MRLEQQAGQYKANKAELDFASCSEYDKASKRQDDTHAVTGFIVRDMLLKTTVEKLE